MAAYTTIDNPELFFQCKTFSGNASTQALTFDNTDTSMQPDLVWLKQRNATAHHHLVDSVRGVGRYLFSNLSNAEGGDGFSDDGNDLLISFDSNGFTIDAGEDANASGATGVAWCWKAGTSFSNDASSTSVGTLDSTGSSSQTAGFSIVSYTSNGSSNQSVAHNLGAVPHMIISKNRDSSSSSYNYWTVYHHKNATANDKKLKLDTNDAVSGTNEWGDTDPTSTVYSLHTSGDGTTNVSTDKMISYVFTGIQGFSKFGTYVGNNTADGPFIYTGFQPAFIMVKSTSTGGSATYSWSIFDTKRSSYNIQRSQLEANTSDAEDTGETADIDILSNGFKPRYSPNDTNGNNTYIYMAFAEQPFVNSNGVPANAR